ncbi:hypothetical protein ACROYT_G014916 [Oculina patagonica]
MALPSNVKLDRSGHPLRFFSPFPCVQAEGTNVFSQALSSGENAYVFPPFSLIGPLLRFLASQPCPFTMVVPDVSPRRHEVMHHKIVRERYEQGKEKDMMGFYHCTVACNVAWCSQQNLPDIAMKKRTSKCHC